MLTPAPFSTRLRAATMPAHTDAEAAGFMAALMDGTITRPAYAALVAQLQPIYAALDTQAAIHRHDVLYGPFFDPRLDRSAALAADVAALGSHAITTATRDYASYLSHLTDPLRVLAHHYTRYLGDLSGGRAIAARLTAHLGMTPVSGLAFYQFDVGPAPAYKNAYRQRMDSLPWTLAEQQGFLAEVSEAYRLNVAVFASLEHLL